MNKKLLRACVLFCCGLGAPIAAPAQCKDQLCQNLQNALDAALTDFREYRTNGIAAPEVSIPGAKIPCQMTAWANNVPMLICYAQIPAASAESWYVNALQSLRSFEPAWQFKIDSPVADHFVDAGPPDCQVPDKDGPYVGNCPLHLQVTKQSDGTMKIYLWVSSFSSPYLVNHPPAPPKKTAPAATAVPNGCDELCQGLKKAFEARVSAFEALRAAKTGGDVSDATSKLAEAAQCAVNTTSKSGSNAPGTQYVCYWTDASSSAAGTRFRDLISRLQVLLPSAWTIRQEDASEELTGTKVTAWLAISPDVKQEVSLYLTSQYVGLHIKSSN
jgi:hypothetical protein